jgi:amino acid adenylation domain-containing protein
VFTWWDQTSESILTYAELSRRARIVATHILLHAKPGARVVLLYPPGLDFAVGLFGCFYAGVIAVPAYPPHGSRGFGLLQTIVDDSGAVLALTDSAHEKAAISALARNGLPTVRTLCVESAAVPSGVGLADGLAPGAASIALLQYTSGSTGTPRGVVVSHGNLMENCAVIHDRFGNSAETRGLIWLPPYHDMGLVGGILQPVFSGIEVLLMAPTAVVQQPLRWLRAISKFRATVSGGPNFAYELCVRRIRPEDREGLDLCSWKIAFTGAEPIRADTMTRFAQAFAPCGFDSRAIYPCYGLAESTLFVTGGPRGTGFDCLQVDSNDDSPKGRRLVACGAPAGAHEVVIVDPDRREVCEDRQRGEIWVAGPSVAQGYWQQPELNREIFHACLQDGRGPFLRTGDLGFLHEGKLYVTGRQNDLLVLHGRNYYPEDIEATVECSHEALHTGTTAAFALEVDGEPKLALLAEVHPRWACRAGTIMAAVRRAVAGVHGVSPHAVMLVRLGDLPRTTSGKVQRFACRRALQENSGAIALSVADTSCSADPPSVKVLSAMPVTERAAVLEGYLVRLVAVRTGVSACEIDPAESLLALGLDSLALAALRCECEERWNTAPPLSDLMAGSATLRTLAWSVAQAGEAVSTTPPVRPEPVWQMTEGQRGLWALERARGREAGLTLARAFSIEGLQPQEFRRALAAMLARHAVLRSCFPETGGWPQVSDRGNTDDWYREIDAIDWDEKDLTACLQAEAACPFDVGQGPLFRVVLFARPHCVWIVLVQAHHIVIDFESLRILITELGAAYAAEVHGETPVFAAPGASYAIFADEECRRIESDVVARRRALDYWREALGEHGSLLRMPADAVPGAQPAGRRVFAIPAETVSNLRELAARERYTLYVLIVSAWAAVLHQLSGQACVLVGCPVSERSSARFARTVGYFLNLLPLRFSFAGEPSLGSVLRAAQQDWSRALEHTGYPFRRVLEDLRLKRNPLDPVFETLVSLNVASRTDAFPGCRWALGVGDDWLHWGDPTWLSLKLMELPPDIPQVPLALSLVDSGDSIAASLEYNAGSFTTSAADNLCGRLLRMLVEMPGVISKPVSRIPLFLPDEREQLTGALSRGIARERVQSTIADCWRVAAKEHADRTALLFPGGSLTFCELDELAHGVAAELLECGLQAEECVGVFAERKPETVAAVLGVLLAGGVYVPLDPTNPPARAARMCGIVGVRRILASGGAKLEWADTVVVQRVSVALNRRAASPAPNLCARSAAYAIFTSGSTGDSKAVIVEHGALCNLVMAQIAAFGIVPGWQVAQCAPFGFDASISELFVTLLAGATLRMAGEQDLLVGDNLARFLQGANAVTLNPWVLASMSEASAFPDLRTLVVAGESCPDSLPRRWATGRRFINAYGPTEATVCATLGCIEAGRSGRVIGRPIENVSVYVLNSALEPVPVGAVAELFVAGAGVARGYLGMPELTADRFLPDPFVATPGARMYRTGDLASWQADGSLHFNGRIDDQVKVHGIRVEPGEVEAALASHPAVRGCAVIPDVGPDRETRLVAYYETAAGPVRPSVWELTGHLSARLPSVMVPALFVPLESLPRNANGKLDRASLAAPRPANRTAARLNTSMEELVADIWREVIAVDSIGPTDNFFEAGGTSLSAGRVQARLQEGLGRTVSLVDLFTYPTVRALASRLEQGGTTASAADRWREAAAKARRATALIQHVNSGGIP